MVIPQISGIVLAGGASRRMGRDKAFLELDGQSLIEIVLERVRAVVTNTPQRYAHLAARLVGDIHPGIGDLGGIHSGLTAATHDHALIVGCDMPFLNPPLLEYLVSLAPPYAPGQLHLNSTVLLATVPGAGQAQKLCQGKYFSHKPPPGRWLRAAETTLYATFESRCDCPALRSLVHSQYLCYILKLRGCVLFSSTLQITTFQPQFFLFLTLLIPKR